jgi:tripartite-type tricarboxylate transporter receptor subunit TctC
MPYKGRQFAIPALIGGQIQLMFDNMPSALPMAREGKIRAVAQTGAKRSPAAPDVPTVAESGLPGFEADQWYGVVAPAGTPAALVAQLNAEINKALALPDVAQQLAGEGAAPMSTTPQAFGQHIAAEIPRWAEVVKAGNVSAN